MSDDMINFEGIEPHVLVHALYHGTRPLGMGYIHNRPNLSVEDTKEVLNEYARRGANADKIYIDYFFGRPLKVTLDLTSKTFQTRLYDRDAGQGAAARVVAKLRGAR